MLNEADSGLTALAMEGAQGRYQGDEFLLVKFYTHARQNRQRSEEEGRPIFEDTHYIQIMTPGNKDGIIQRPATEMDKQRFPEHYRKFLAREDQQSVEGTPLEDWAGVTRGQCEELRFLNIRTVEQLAGMSDANSQGMMGINMLKAKAEKYIEDSKTNATADALAEMRAINEQLQAQLAELQGGKPKRKRRTKAEIEADKAEAEKVDGSTVDS